MKIQKVIALSAALCALSILKASAADIIQTITITIKAVQQNENGTSNGTTTNVPPPTVSTHNTAELLARLAQDEFAELNWASNSFPSGAQLAVVPSQSSGPDFAVILGTNILVDVSDIISFKSGNNEVVSGTQNLQTGLASPLTKKIYTGKFTFDDSNAGNPDGSLVFSLRGIFTDQTIDTPPKNGFYTESHSTRLTSGTGDGMSPGGPFVCTGLLTATGKAVLPAP